MKVKLLVGATVVISLQTAFSQITVNEVDADTPGSDAAEFVELYSATGSTSLDGYALVFLNGSNEQSYLVQDLTGQSTGADGYFVFGNPGVPNVDLTFDPGASGALQNGADAVALYSGATAAAFIDGSQTAATATGLVDALAYDTNDADATGLLTALGLSEQYNEGEFGDKDNHSVQRSPDGAATALVATATPGAANVLGGSITISLDTTSLLESDNSGEILVTVSRTGTTGDLDVALVLDDASEAVLGADFITIADGLSSEVVSIFAVDDTYPDGDQTVTVTATPVPGESVSETFTVTDDPGDSYTLVFNEINGIPQTDLNGDGLANNDDEFIEILNVSASPIDLTGYTLSDEFSDVHFFRDGTVLEAGCALIVGSGGFSIGSQAGVFGTAEVQNASEGTTLRITDDGDVMRLFNDFGEEVYTVVWPNLTATATDGTWNLMTDGDVTSGYAQHVNIAAADGIESPGTDVSGNGFCDLTEALMVTPSPATVGEDAGFDAVTVTITTPSNVTSDVEVFVYSKDESEIGVPGGDPLAFATIDSGTNSTSVTLDVIDDAIIDGTQSVVIVAGASGYLNGEGTVDVTDEGDVPTFTDLVINEVDADTPGADTAEFIELYNKTASEQSLQGLVLVLINGSNDSVYDAIDLSSQTIAANGFFVVGDVPEAAFDVNDSSGIQNGADAVALYIGSEGDFPDGTAVTSITNTLVDAVVYDTNDGDDVVLINALTPGQAQLNEDEGGDKDNESNSRVPDGGAAFDTSLYVTQVPTPGATNVLAVGGEIVITDCVKSGSDYTITFTSPVNVDVYKTTDLQDFTTLGDPYASDVSSPYTDSAASESAAFYILVPTGDVFP